MTLKLKPKPTRRLKHLGPLEFTHICETCQCGSYNENCHDRKCPEFNASEQEIKAHELNVALAKW